MGCKSNPNPTNHRNSQAKISILNSCYCKEEILFDAQTLILVEIYW